MDRKKDTIVLRTVLVSEKEHYVILVLADSSAPSHPTCNSYARMDHAPPRTTSK